METHGVDTRAHESSERSERVNLPRDHGASLVRPPQIETQIYHSVRSCLHQRIFRKFDLISTSDFQVFKFLEAHLPEFTELNWTSSMREYVFSPCEDGTSTFTYNGDISALVSLFKSEANGEMHEGQTAYIEVMQLGKGNQCRQLNGKLFDQVFSL